MKSFDLFVKMLIVLDELIVVLIFENEVLGKEGFNLECIEVKFDIKCFLEFIENDGKFIVFVKWFVIEFLCFEVGEKGMIY